MNIFVLDPDPVVAARFLCDKHVPKMLLESAQLLCSPFESGVAPYKRTHFQHPCAVWARSSLGNYRWLLAHAEALVHQHQNRFPASWSRKVGHRSSTVIEWCRENYLLSLRFLRFETTPFVQVVPEQYRRENPVEAYRAYYRAEKARFARWERGVNAPEWWASTCGQSPDTIFAASPGAI